jgi:hypothetical protein
MNNPLTTITEIRNSNPIMEEIFMQGSCCNLYFILKSIFPNASAYFNLDHVITKIDNKFYDITGEVSPTGYSPIEEWFDEYKDDEGLKNGPMYIAEEKSQYVRK